MTHPWHFTVFLALLLSPAAHGARIPLETHGARKYPPPAVPLALPLKGRAAHCIKAAKNHTDGDVHAMCDEWEGAVRDLHTAVSLWKRIWESKAMVESTFGSKDALVSTVIDGISALRMNLTEWAAQMDSNRRIWVKNANDAIDTYAADSGVASAVSLVTAVISFVPCLNEFMLIGSGASDVVFGVVTKNDIKSIEAIFDRGLDTVFLSEQGRKIKGMMDLLQITDLMENATDPGMDSLGRMLMHYVSSAAASNRTFTAAIVSDDLDRLGNVTMTDLDVYVDAFYDATLDRSSDIAAALAATTVRFVNGLIWFGSSLVKLGVHMHYLRKKNIELKNIFTDAMNRYDAGVTRYTLHEDLTDIFKDSDNMKRVRQHSVLEYRINKLISLLGDDRDINHEFFRDRVSDIMGNTEVEKYFTFDKKSRKIIPGRQDSCIQKLREILEKDKEATFQKIVQGWGKVSPELGGEIKELISEMGRYAKDHTLIGGVIQSIEGYSDYEGTWRSGVDSEGKFKIHSGGLDRGWYSNIELLELEEHFTLVHQEFGVHGSIGRTEYKFKNLEEINPFVNMLRRRKIVALDNIEQLAKKAQVHIENLGKGAAGEFPLFKKAEFSKRTATAKYVGYGMATLAVAMVGVNVELMVSTVADLRKNVTALALNDAAIMNDVLKTAQAWREM